MPDYNGTRKRFYRSSMIFYFENRLFSNEDNIYELFYQKLVNLENDKFSYFIDQIQVLRVPL